jgi:drug/metabolite transporter (DMT)-like permease
MNWLWIPITLTAALLQTARNAAQRGLVKTAGTLGATLVRFLYGLPFTLVFLLLLEHFLPQPAHSGISTAFVAWITFGAVAQLFATALMLLAMQSSSFAVATALIKTEVLQVALFGFVLLSETLTHGAMAAVCLSVAGVLMLSVKPAAASMRTWLSSAALYGIAAGGLFALSAVGYRGAALLHPGWSPFYNGAYNLVWAQSIQTLLLGGWLLVRNRGALVAAMREWRLSLAAGFLGAAGSFGWFTAFAMRPAVDVRALSLVEVLFGYLVSHRLLKEKTERRELLGMVLLVMGLVVLVLSA